MSTNGYMTTNGKLSVFEGFERVVDDPADSILWYAIDMNPKDVSNNGGLFVAEYDVTRPDFASIVSTLDKKKFQQLDIISELINAYYDRNITQNMVPYKALYAVMWTYVDVPTYGETYQGVSFIDYIVLFETTGK